VKHNKTIITLLLVVNVATNLLAQDRKLPDSIQLSLDTARQPESKVWALIEAGDYTYQGYTIAAYNQAGDYFQQALAIAQKTKDPKLINSSYVSLAGVYDALGNDKLPKALEYYTLFKNYSLGNIDTPIILRSYMNVISVQERLKMTEECKDNLIKMTELAVAFNKWPNTNRVFALAAFYAIKLNDEKLCREYLSKIDTSKSPITNGSLPYLRYYLMSNLFLLGKDKRFEEAMKTGKKALASVNNKSDSMQLYFELADFAYLAGYYKDAYQYRTTERDLYNQIVNQTSMNEASNKLLQGELKLKEENEKLLEQKQLSQQKWNRFLIVGISLLGLLAIAVWWQAKARRSQNKILSQQVEENKLLLNEVHHRVKNNLQIISSFMLLQETKEDDNTNKELLKQLQSKIGALALVHQMLQNQQVHEKVKIKDYFEQLSTQIIATHTNDPSSIHCEINMDDTVLPLDEVTSLAFITIELLLNTIKYVVPSQQRCTITITAQKDEKHLLFTYADSGSGLPAHINIEKPTSTGLRLVKRLAAQLGSTLETDKQNGIFTYRFGVPV
jgi:two-component sensor histidine kinase